MRNPADRARLLGADADRIRPDDTYRPPEERRADALVVLVQQALKDARLQRRSA